MSAFKGKHGHYLTAFQGGIFHLKSFKIVFRGSSARLYHEKITLRQQRDESHAAQGRRDADPPLPRPISQLRLVVDNMEFVSGENNTPTFGDPKDVRRNKLIQALLQEIPIKPDPPPAETPPQKVVPKKAKKSDRLVSLSGSSGSESLCSQPFITQARGTTEYSSEVEADEDGDSNPEDGDDDDSDNSDGQSMVFRGTQTATQIEPTEPPQALENVDQSPIDSNSIPEGRKSSRPGPTDPLFSTTAASPRDENSRLEVVNRTESLKPRPEPPGWEGMSTPTLAITRIPKGQREILNQDDGTFLYLAQRKLKMVTLIHYLSLVASAEGPCV